MKICSFQHAKELKELIKETICQNTFEFIKKNTSFQ